MLAHCGNPWQATPRAANPGDSAEAAGLNILWPWRGNVPLGPTGQSTYRFTRIGAGAAGTRINNPNGYTIHNPAAHIHVPHWTQTADQILAASGQRTSYLSTIGVNDEAPNAEGGTVTVEASPGEEVEITFAWPHAGGTPGGTLNIGGIGQMRLHLLANPDWFTATSIGLGESLPPDGILSYGWTFTIAPDIEEEYIEILLTPYWAESLAGGHRSVQGYVQDIWFALPWFERTIRIELTGVQPMFNCTFIDGSEEQIWDWVEPSCWGNADNEHYQLWLDAVADARAANPNASDDEISEIASEAVWQTWATRGQMGMFVHPEHGPLPSGPSMTGGPSTLERVLEVVEGICDGKLTVFMTPEEAIAMAEALGIPLNLEPAVLECISDIDPLVGTWADFGGDFEGDCTSEEWEDHVLERLLPEMLATLAAVDPDCKDDKPPPPPQEPPADDCTPEEVDLCGDYECYEFTRGDNTDEQDEGLTGLQDEEEIELRWNNIAFAFAETHMATSGFNNAGPSTPAPNINLTRTSEVFQAMAG